MDIAERLAKERRGRLAAERLLDLKRRELSAANLQLAEHARTLAAQVIAQRQGLATARSEAEALKGQNSRAAATIERATQAADMARERLLSALGTLADGFAIFDGGLRLVMANEAYLTLFGAGRGIGPGAHYDAVVRGMAEAGTIDLGGRDLHDWCHEMAERIMRGDIPPVRLSLADGRHVRLVDRRARNGDLVSQAVDVTEAVRREAELDEARARAEAASRAKSAFLANMSHEIRTPMNGVVGMADLLIESGLGEEQRLFAETIRSSGEALLSIINDVLDYSKIEADRLRLYPEPFDLERTVHEVLVLLQPSARDKGLRLAADFDVTLPTHYVGDRGRIRQILTNLAGNAVKFTASGHVLVRVIGFPAGDGTTDLRITVEDTGIGIAAEHIEHIFGEFNQVEDQANRKFEGTGLGLAITRSLVDLMGGSVWVDSVRGEGSVFGVRLALPVAEADGPPPALRPGDCPLVLILDPDPLGRSLLERQVAALGARAVACRSVAEAAAALGTQRPDVVVAEDATADLAALSGGAWGRGDAPPGFVLLQAAGESDGPRAPAGWPLRIVRKPVLRSALLAAIAGLRGGVRDAAAAAPEVPAAEAPLRRMRVLAAEDNRTNRLVFAKMTRDWEIDLQFAENGREAVEMWRSLRPDIVFMDISMPEMDGREATRRIRAEEGETGRDRVTIVALTAHAMEGDSESILAAGLDRYLTKPLRRPAIEAELLRVRPAGTLPPVPASGGGDLAQEGLAEAVEPGRVEVPREVAQR